MTKQEAINTAYRILNECMFTYPGAFSDVSNWMSRHSGILNQLKDYTECRFRGEGEMFCYAIDNSSFIFVEYGEWNDDGDYVYGGHEVIVDMGYYYGLRIRHHYNNGIVENLWITRDNRFNTVFRGQFSQEDSDNNTLENTNRYFWRIQTDSRPKFQDARIERSNDTVYEFYWDNHREEYVRIK